MTARCRRPEDHAGLHADGTRWFGDDGLQHPRELTGYPKDHKFPSCKPSRSTYIRGCRCSLCKGIQHDYYISRKPVAS